MPTLQVLVYFLCLLLCKVVSLAQYSILTVPLAGGAVKHHYCTFTAGKEAKNGSSHTV